MLIGTHSNYVQSLCVLQNKMVSFTAGFSIMGFILQFADVVTETLL